MISIIQLNLSFWSWCRRRHQKSGAYVSLFATQARQKWHKNSVLSLNHLYLYKESKGI